MKRKVECTTTLSWQKPYASEQLRWLIWPTFPLNFLMKFSQKMPLYFVYTMMQRSQKWPKTQIKGGSFFSPVFSGRQWFKVTCQMSLPVLVYIPLGPQNTCPPPLPPKKTSSTHLSVLGHTLFQPVCQSNQYKRSGVNMSNYWYIEKLLGSSAEWKYNNWKGLLLK